LSGFEVTLIGRIWVTPEARWHHQRIAQIALEDSWPPATDLTHNAETDWPVVG